MLSILKRSLKFWLCLKVTYLKSCTKGSLIRTLFYYHGICAIYVDLYLRFSSFYKKSQQEQEQQQQQEQEQQQQLLNL